MLPKKSVLVVDDHTLYRKGCMMLVGSFDAVGDVYEAENGKAAIDLLAQTSVDIVLMDLDMPVMGGKEAARHIIKNHKDVSVIMVSMNDDLSMISELIEMGVHSYLVKTTEPEELEKAITYVINNDFYYNQIVSKALHKKLKDRPPIHKENHLTPREVEILELICHELTMREIGDKLFLSEQTVHTHRKNLMKKLSVNNAVGLVKYAIKEQIISL